MCRGIGCHLVDDEVGDVRKDRVRAQPLQEHPRGAKEQLARRGAAFGVAPDHVPNPRAVRTQSYLAVELPQLVVDAGGDADGSEPPRLTHHHLARPPRRARLLQDELGHLRGLAAPFQVSQSTRPRHTHAHKRRCVTESRSTHKNN